MISCIVARAISIIRTHGKWILDHVALLINIVNRHCVLLWRRLRFLVYHIFNKIIVWEVERMFLPVFIN